MALLKIDHTSECAGVNLPLYMVLPHYSLAEPQPLEHYRVLYLLHGLSDDGSAWQRNTPIEQFARRYNLIVVMPSAGRSFYADMANGQAYFRYITEEVPALLKATFRLNLARENTSIAGLSMGGYGAFKAAFLRPELYSAAASFSGLLLMNEHALRSETPVSNKLRKELGLIYGGLDQIAGSVNDPLAWLAGAAGRTETLPELYAACGLQDELLQINESFVSQAREHGIRVAYVTDAGAHTWEFWEKHLALWLEKRYAAAHP